MGRIIQRVEDKIIRSTSFDGKHELEFNEVTHRYKLDEKRVPGATTIGSVYPKGEGLVRWMIEQGIEEYNNKTALEKGGDIGTVLHTFAECYEKKVPFDQELIERSPYATEIRSVVSKFVNWRSRNNDEVVRAEDIIASPLLGVGGRIDTLRNRPGLGFVLSDYKTSKNVYISHFIQVIGGYRRMLREWLNIEVPYVEIACFPKDPNAETIIVLADNNGFVKDGQRTEVPSLFLLVEQQFERNLGTYTFQKEVENKLNPYIPNLRSQ